MGWMKEALEEMKIAEANAVVYGNADENEVVESSLAYLQQEIENGGENGSKDIFLFVVLLIMVYKRKNLKRRTKPEGRR
jgi:hypothetical protein